KSAFELSMSQPAQRAIASSLAEIRTKPDRFVVAFHGLVPVPLPCERHTQVIPGVGTLGSDADRAAQPYDCLVKLAEVRERDAKVHLRIKRVRLELECTAVIDDRFLGPALFPECDSQVVENAEVILLELIRPKIISHGLA